MLTVLFASFNGAKRLPQVLEAFSALESPPGGWKLVAVDNGSSDSTGEVLLSFRGRLPLICASEPARGKNAALNTGMQFAEGDFIVLTDDDVLPNRDWLVQLRRSADEQPDYAVFGGTILPEWATPPEPWILNSVPMGLSYGLTDPGWPDGPTVASRVFGPNMAVRASVFASGFRFNTAIGPNGTNYAMGSEAEFVRRVLGAGYKAWHSASAVVHHIIRREQMTREWVLGRAVRFGRGQYRLNYHEFLRPPRSLMGIPLYMVREMAEHAFSMTKARISGDARALFQEQWKLRYLYGQAVEARILNHEEAQTVAAS